MYFNKTFGIKEFGKDEKVFYRVAIRAIILSGDKILMVKANTGDYKFPGGGVEKGETKEETLKREVKEETGYLLKEIKEKFGVLVERNRRRRMGCTIFDMTSHYYICSVKDERGEQRLDKYEEELGFTPVWISIEDVIRENENVIKSGEKINPWVKRETFVLKKIREYLYKKNLK